MKDEAARRAGTEWGELVQAADWPPERGRLTPDQFRLMRAQIRAELRELVPDSEHIAVVPDGDWPSVLVLSGDALYRTTGSGAVKEGDDFSTACQRVPLDAATSSVKVSVTAYMWPQNAERRVSTWTFAIANETVSVELDEWTGMEPDDNRAFVRALAASLGWDFPPEPALSAAA